MDNPRYTDNDSSLSTKIEGTETAILLVVSINGFYHPVDTRGTIRFTRIFS